MDEMCNKTEVEDLHKTVADTGVVDNVKRCASPVFKCVNNTRAIRGINLDSSDYDIPSYQINQSVKSRTSSKYGSETSESVLPFSPVFSPIPNPPTTQFQPPSIHSLGTVAKTLHKSFKNKVNNFLNDTSFVKPCEPFESLGMTDKDISWVSSMASPPPKCVPGSEFNTIEKATFFPEEKFQNIQPRALFPPNLDGDFGCHPISFCSESENDDDDVDDEAYKSNIRLSDVCATLRQLEVKTLDQASDCSPENVTLEEGSLLSPVIRTKKNKLESVKKKKKNVSVVLPDNQDKYEFHVEHNKSVKYDKVKSDVGSNFMEEDSFQSMSFTCIDELCKTLVTEGSTSSTVSKSGDCDKSLVNTTTINSKTNFPKIFYDSKAAAEVYEVSSVNDLHSYAKALEEGDTCITVNSKISKTFAEKGIVRFDVFSKDSAKIDATKRLHSEVSEESDTDSEKKFKKLEEENTGWEKMKQYLSESQLNVSDGEIFRTVENLEKTLASQDSKDLEKLSVQNDGDTKNSLVQNLSVSTSWRASSEITEEEDAMASNFDESETCRIEDGEAKDSGLNVQETPLVGFTNALGSKISVSKKALDKAKEILRDCSEKVEGKELMSGSDELIQISGGISETTNISMSGHGALEETLEPSEHPQSYCLGPSKQNFGEGLMTAGFFSGSGKQIQVSAKALEKAKALMSECDQISEVEIKKTVPGGFHTGSGRKIQVSANSLEKAQALMKEFDEASEATDRSFMEGFSTASGKQIEVSSKALEKAKALMRECDGASEEATDRSFMEGFSTASGKQIEVSSKALEKAKALMRECDGISEEATDTSLMEGFSTGSGKQIKVSAKALEKAKALMRECDEASEMTDRSFTEGFSTASGKQIQISGKALEKAKALMRECDGASEELTDRSFMEVFSSCSGEKMEGIAKASEKLRPLWADCGESSRGNRPTFRGFSTGSGKTVSVSAEALERAKAQFLDCEHELTVSSSERTRRKEIMNQSFDSCERVKSDVEIFEMKSEKPQTFTGQKEQGNNILGFSTALGNKVKVSSKALEKAKSLWRETEEVDINVTEAFPREPSLTGFSTPGGFKTSKAALEKSNERMKGKSELEDSENRDYILDGVKNSMKNGSEASKLEVTDISGPDGTDDWDEIIPGWLHVYNTKPSVASDRIELSPVIAHEDGKSSRPDREYVVKSPVLGSGDRFHGKRKRRKLRYKEDKELEHKSQTGFVVPYTDAYRKGGAKRTSALSIDFSVPFKRVKFVEEAGTANCDVKVERARRREEQEKAIKEKHKVKPSKGLHLRKKCSEKQISWLEAVGGSSPEIHSDEVLKSMGVLEDVIRVSIRNAGSFSFNGEDFFGPSCKKNIEGIPAGDGCVVILDDENRFGIEELKRAFLASWGVQPNLVPEGWVENHYKWIVWKLAHYERSFPRYFAGKCLTPNNVMLQLRYRYDREIDRNERSALKKILERDDTSVKRLVLCVCGIEKTGGSDAPRYELNLTDGWYSCPARTDPAMTRLLDEGKLCVGTKLMTQGAVLVNCEQGVSPLEICGSDMYLKISTNSTRRVKWDTKLGFQRNPKNFPISLGSILAQGGPISRIDVIIVRIYPVLYMEKTSDGHHVTRNRRLEEKADAEYRRIQEQKMEAICNEFRMEMRKSVISEKESNTNRLSNFEQVEGICELMDSTDPSDLQEQMTVDQRRFLENFQSNQSDRMSRELLEKIKKKLESENLLKRNVSEFFRAKIVDFRKPDYNNPAVLSVWHPSEDLLGLLSEGKVISLMNVAMSNSSRMCKPMQINTTRQTQYIPIPRSVKYPARKLTQLKDVSSKVCPAFEEVDLVGMVVLVQDISYGSRLSQVVYLTDINANFVGIVFWGNCKNYGWENVLRTQCIVACSNLQWKRNYSPQDVPSLYVTESSVFTENPKQSYMKEEMGKLKQSLPQDVTAFLSKCEEDLLTRLEEAKWRANSNRNSSTNESTPGGSILPKSRENGFESKPTASSTPIKSFTARISPEEAEPSPIQKRIEKLQAYGEPPSLIPLIIRNNVKRKFRKKSSVSRTCQ